MLRFGAEECGRVPERSGAPHAWLARGAPGMPPGEWRQFRGFRCSGRVGPLQHDSTVLGAALWRGVVGFWAGFAKSLGLQACRTNAL